MWDRQVVAALVPGVRPRLVIATRHAPAEGTGPADASTTPSIRLTLAVPRLARGWLHWSPELRIADGLVWEANDGEVTVRWVDGDASILARTGRFVSPTPWGLGRSARVTIDAPGDSPLWRARGPHRGVVVGTPATAAHRVAPASRAPVPLLRPRPVVTDPALSSPVPSGA